MNIGIIGGGQLALMMIQENPEHSYFVLEPKINSSIKNFAEQIIADYDNPKALKELYSKVDVITYEFENIKSSSLEIIEDKLFPNKEILEISQNRLKEKKIAQKLGLKTTNFWEINNISDLEKVLNENLDKKFILKTTSLGYDGKGQITIHKNNEIKDDIKKLIQNSQCILEEFIDLQFETSVIGFRDVKGNFTHLPLTNNVHKNNILHITENYKNLQFEKIIKQTKNIMTELNVVGTLCVEFFILKNGEPCFNEMAPRPHNSGHWSIEGTTQSQFKNHINAVTQSLVVKPETIGFTTMINLLGNDFLIKDKVTENQNIKFHDYFKDVIKPNRKMAHITVNTKTIEENKKLINEILEKLEE